MVEHFLEPESVKAGEEQLLVATAALLHQLTTKPVTPYSPEPSRVGRLHAARFPGG